MSGLFGSGGKLQKVLDARQSKGSKQYTGIDPADTKLDRKPKQTGSRGPAGRPLGSIRTPLSVR